MHDTTSRKPYQALAEAPESWTSTRNALHGRLLAIAAVPRAHAEPQPHWWHIGLRLVPTGLTTAPVALPSGEMLTLGADLAEHIVWWETTGGSRGGLPIASGSATEFGDRLLAEMIGLGLDDRFDREKFASDESLEYDPAAAAWLLETLGTIYPVFERHRATLEGQPGPILLWSHHLDMSFEWFGSKMVEGEDGEKAPAQLNLGYDPADDPYFYSNPWPFPEHLLDTALPGHARWHTDGWKGTELSTAALIGDSNWEDRVLDYAATVHRLARPSLMA